MVLGHWRALGLYRKSYLCFLPLQFDKFSPKLDSPYFRHSNVSPCVQTKLQPNGGVRTMQTCLRFLLVAEGAQSSAQGPSTI